MDVNFSWKKAFFGSISVHLVLLLGIAMFFVHSVKEKTEIYEIDLQTSLSAGSGHSGGGGADFPAPLKASDVAARIESVNQRQSVIEPQVPSNESVISDSVANDNGATNDANNITGSGSGIGNGQGTGQGDGVGDGRGYGDGAGSGEGSGYSGAAGSGNAPFDTEGFWAAVDNAKQYPAAAIKRHLTGSVTVVVTIDASGNCLDVSLVSSSGHNVLDQAAMRAVRNACPYPNPTGQTVTVQVPVHFRASE